MARKTSTTGFPFRPAELARRIPAAATASFTRTSRSASARVPPPCLRLRKAPTSGSTCVTSLGPSAARNSAALIAADFSSNVASWAIAERRVGRPGAAAIMAFRPSASLKAASPRIAASCAGPLPVSATSCSLGCSGSNCHSPARCSALGLSMSCWSLLSDPAGFALRRWAAVTSADRAASRLVSSV